MKVINEMKFKKNYYYYLSVLFQLYCFFANILIGLLIPRQSAIVLVIVTVRVLSTFTIFLVCKTMLFVADARKSTVRFSLLTPSSLDHD